MRAYVAALEIVYWPVLYNWQLRYGIRKMHIDQRIIKITNDYFVKSTVVTSYVKKADNVQSVFW